MGNSNVDKVGKSAYKYEVIQTVFFEKDLEKHYKSGQLMLVKKIRAFLVEIAQHPTTGTGKPEQLKWIDKNRQFWSRRVDKRHRLVYEIREEEKKVFLFNCYDHYQAKVITWLTNGHL